MNRKEDSLTSEYTSKRGGCYGKNFRIFYEGNETVKLLKKCRHAAHVQICILRKGEG